MKKLLGVVLCFGLAFALGIGQVGCKKKDKDGKKDEKKTEKKTEKKEPEKKEPEKKEPEKKEPEKKEPEKKEPEKKEPEKKEPEKKEPEKKEPEKKEPEKKKEASSLPTPEAVLHADLFLERRVPVSSTAGQPQPNAVATRRLIS